MNWHPTVLSPQLCKYFNKATESVVMNSEGVYNEKARGGKNIPHIMCTIADASDITPLCQRRQVLFYGIFSRRIKLEDFGNGYILIVLGYYTQQQ